MAKLVGYKRKSKKLYTFTVPYSQTNSESASPVNKTTPKPQQCHDNTDNDKGYFLEMCDIFGETVDKNDKSSENEPLGVQTMDHGRVDCRERSTKAKVNNSKKRTYQTSAVVVNGCGIAVHEREAPLRTRPSPTKLRKDADKRMIRLQVLNTIFKMKNELAIIRERRLKLARKQQSTAGKRQSTAGKRQKTKSAQEE